MAEYIRFRVGAAKLGVTMAFMALLAGISDKARAATPSPRADAAASIPGLSFLKLDKLYVKLDDAILKLEHKLAGSYLTAHKANDTFLKIKTASAQYLKIADANEKWLKITDANAQFLKIDGTAANAQKVGGLPVSSLVQGNNTSVVSGALPAVQDSPQQLLSLPGGIIVVSIAHPPGAGSVITFHNASNTDLTMVGPVNGQPASITLKAGQDTPVAVMGSLTQDLQFQIFPGGGFTNVVSILIALTPNPSNQGQLEAVGQAFTGGV
jgi:hypothetical protein